MSRPRFLFDENVEPYLLAAVWRLDPTAEMLRVGDETAPPLGTPDGVIVQFCGEGEFVLVTRDRATMPDEVRAYPGRGGHLPGVFLLRQGARVSAIVEDLLLLAGAYDEEEWRDRIAYLPL